MVYAPRPKLSASFLGGSESKIRKGYSKTSLETHEIFRFQVAMVYTEGMTMLYSIKDLEECALDKGIIPQITTLEQYLNKKILVWGVLHNEI